MRIIDNGVRERTDVLSGVDGCDLGGWVSCKPGGKEQTEMGSEFTWKGVDAGEDKSEGTRFS